VRLLVQRVEVGARQPRAVGARGRRVETGRTAATCEPKALRSQPVPYMILFYSAKEDAFFEVFFSKATATLVLAI